MKNNDVISSDGTVFGFESLQNELIRSSDEILRDLKADIDPFVTGKSMNQSMRSNNSQEKSQNGTSEVAPITPNSQVSSRRS